MGRPPRRAPSRPVELLPYPDDHSADYEDGGYNDGSWMGAVAASFVWCLLPVFLYAGWGLALASGSKDGCFDSNGEPCASARVVAWRDLMAVAPYIGCAIALSGVVAAVLWKVTSGWRSTTVGFAASVVGAGIMTVLWSTLHAGG